MSKVLPFQPMEIFLQPGDYYFGDKDTRIRTVLGSCVSATFWHPHLLVGGMCHYLLPSRDWDRREVARNVYDGRYADEVILMMLKEIDAIGTPYKEYHVKLFGGGNMFTETFNHRKMSVGERNIEIGRELIKKHGFYCAAEHLGGNGHRNVIFDVWNGDVWIKHSENAGVGSSRLDNKEVKQDESN